MQNKLGLIFAKRSLTLLFPGSSFVGTPLGDDWSSQPVIKFNYETQLQLS